MDIKLRRGTPADAEISGRICYEASKTISQAHNFPPDFPSADVATGLISRMLGHPGFYSVIAEIDGRVVGSNFLDERNVIAGVGPITVDPAVQNRSIGRQLMDAVHRRVAEKNLPGVRLLQSGFHMRSLSLYMKLGYDVRETVACFQGPAVEAAIDGYSVRPAGENDLAACNQLCRQVHGHDRDGELLDSVRQGTATVVEHDGRITGYATIIGFFGH